MSTTTLPPLLVPQADPGAAYRANKAAIDAAIARVLESGWYILGAEGAAFETEFAAWLGCAHAIGCANGTDAIALILRGLGIGAGMTVATVSHTAVASVAAIEMAGATPLLLDIDPAHYTLDPQELADVLAHPPAGLPPIRAVLLVHLYGQSADLDAIQTITARHGVALIEDCAQSHGALWQGRKLGTFGVASAFSLYPTKNLAALGDGGVIGTDDAALAARIGALRQYGWRERYVSDLVGINSRLDEMQAAVLRVRLPLLGSANQRRRGIAARYDAVLGARAPALRDGGEHVYHQYVIRSTDRATAQAMLRARGVGTAIHYPMPVHAQPAYRDRVALGPAGCRQTDIAACEVLSLPVHPELDDEQVGIVVDAIRHL
jgi:dTDP-4-amino-4,6-dideoxygalactose transaminase